MLRHLVPALFAALIVGMTAGGIEGLAYFQETKAQNPPPLMILLITAIYALYWGGLGILIGAVCGLIFRRKDASEPAPLFGRYLLLFICLYGGLFAFGAYYAGHEDNPASPVGLLLGIGVIAALAVIAFMVQKTLRKIETRGATFKVAVSGLWIVFMVVVLVIGLRPPAESGGGALAKKPTADRPNILFVLVDALRADHLKCYGYDRDTGPSVDALAADGVLFERCYAQSSWTRPSIASMLTGTVPPFHRVTDVASVINSEFEVFPDTMSNYGYLTSSFSASALISRSFGFAMNVDAYKASTRTLSIETGLFKTRLGILHEQIGDEGRLGWPGDNVYRLYNKVYRNLVGLCALFGEEFRIMKGDAASVNETFLKWVDRIDGARFATYLHYLEPHSPYNPDPPFDTMFESDWEGEPVINPPHLLPNEKVLAQFPPIEDEARRDMIAHYDGEIAQFSHEFANLVSEMKKRGIYDDTFIIFVSDHGDEFHEHGAWGHGHSVYNELIRVPMIFKFPKSEYAGQVVSAPVRCIDILPTVFGLLKVDPWVLAKGTDLLPLVRGEEPKLEDSWLAISITGVDNAFVRTYIHEGRYKVIHAVRQDEGREHWWMFDLENDPGEMHDLVNEQPELFEDLRKKLEEEYEKYDYREGSGQETEMSPEMKRKLKKLGYI